MKPPIILCDYGDIDVYESVDDFCTDVETTDIENDEYLVFDSQGRLLKPGVKDDRVVIEEAELRPSHETVLRYFLLWFLNGLEKNIQAYKQQPIEELVASVRDLLYKESAEASPIPSPFLTNALKAPFAFLRFFVGGCIKFGAWVIRRLINLP